MPERALTIDEVPTEFLARCTDLTSTHWAFSDITEASVENDYEFKADRTEK
jgi:hypothetical protein